MTMKYFIVEFTVCHATNTEVLSNLNLFGIFLLQRDKCAILIFVCEKRLQQFITQEIFLKKKI